MNIYISHASSFDYRAELYLPVRNSKLNTIYNFILPHEHTDKPYLLKEKLHEIALIIAEVSYPSTGQGIELGWASMSNIPVICIYRKGSKFSSSLQTITEKIIEYTDRDDMLDKIKLILENLR